MIYILQRAYVWLRRFTHLRGNGIHSPFAYNFVCEVINNTLTYYAYLDHASLLHSLNLRQRKQAKLLFRLINYAQPTTTYIPPTLSHLLPFLHASCAKTSIQFHDQKIPSPSPSSPILIITQQPLAQPLPTLPPGSTLVYLRLRNKATRQQWKNITALPTATMNFDLYHLGITIIAPTLYKHHYKINF